MPKYIIKMSKDGVDRYFEWSTIIDAPATYGLTLDEFHQYIRDEYGERGLESLPARMARVEKHGTSAIEGHSVEHIIKGNRCAEWEKDAFPPKPPRVEADGETYEDLSWTLDEIWEFYVTRRDEGDEDDEVEGDDANESDDEPPPGWRFLYDPKEGMAHVPPCVPSDDLVYAVGRLFDHAELRSKDDDNTRDEPLSTPRKLEEARRINAELLAILQP